MSIVSNCDLFIFTKIVAFIYLLLNVPGQGWVGWRNDTRAGHPVEIKFEFDKVREFSAIHIYCNNQFTKDVQVRFFKIKFNFF